VIYRFAKTKRLTATFLVPHAITALHKRARAGLACRNIASNITDKRSHFDNFSPTLALWLPE
jgi:hypothetical protein